jgi:predicted transglutaminase-like cysteine proteinase
LLLSIFVGGIPLGSAAARTRLLQSAVAPAPLVEASSTLAPFQHVRFCLRYPDECKSEATKHERIELTVETLGLLNLVNRDVNATIAPTRKSYRANLQDGWTIAPTRGDCNDYAVTKRHELLRSGLPGQALRLAVVSTDSGEGHLVLVVATTRGDLVMDNLTDAIRPWQSTDYHWLKIQSTRDARFWFEIKLPGSTMSKANQKARFG